MSDAIVRILIADDHPIVLTGLKALIQADPRLQVVGEAGEGRTALRLATSSRPDVIVLDISMPEMSGIEVARVLSVEQPECRILVMTEHEDRGTVQQVLDLGVAGYLVKRSASSEVIHAIHVVAAGGTYIDPMIAGKLVGRQSPSPELYRDLDLREREVEVLRLIANGHRNREISVKWGVSEKTVQTYKTRAMAKLGLKTRVELMQYATIKGWRLDAP